MRSSIIKKSKESSILRTFFLLTFYQAFGWRFPKFLLKSVRKMRQAFKTQVEVERRRFSIFNFNKMLCRNQSFILQSFSWRHSEYLLTSTVGFNYLHYLLNGYIVLLPDLQYETGNVKNSMLTSLEKSIDSVKILASVDDHNIGIAGLSYGGYETGLALGNSKYFKTGVAGVMVSDLVSLALSNSEINTTPNYMRVENQQFRMNSNVFDDWKNYWEHSPIYYLKSVEAPVLIWTGLKDKNVPPSQSKMFFLGLKRLQKKAVLLEYENETHNMMNPANQLDLNVKIWQWFDYHLKNKSPAAWITPL